MYHVFAGAGLPAILSLFLTAMSFHLPASAAPPLVPPPKAASFGEEVLELPAVRIEADTALQPRERNAAEAILRRAGISPGEEGVPLRLQLGTVALPEHDEHPYGGEIRRQAHRVTVREDAILVEGNSPEAVFHGLQTLAQLLDGPSIRHAEVHDWPDIPIRMIMVDPARQNENMDYYRRVIDFAARYKINAILCHLTDDQTSVLHHDDYPELLHHEAWTPAQIEDLVAYAADRHIELIPEIESLGHSRVFEWLPDFEDYLHQTEDDDPDESWYGTDIPGYTNVLCPASEKAVRYLEEMYALSRQTFGHEWIHIGFDEVDMTNCERCREAFGEQTHEQWLTAALRQADRLVRESGGRTALWGDMLLAHPQVADEFAGSDMIIFDWYYRPDVTDSSVRFFLERGYEVIASPALACAPHMIIPDRNNYENIARFCEIARNHKLPGVNTTIWVPVRYMSDVMWTGIAYAAAHSWGGSNFDKEHFFTAFMADYFGSGEGDAYRRAWARLADVEWHRPDIYTACWVDEGTLEAARSAAERREDEVRRKISEIEQARAELARIRPTVTQNEIEWRTIEHSAEILQYTMEHLLAAPQMDVENPPAELLADLAGRCSALIDIIEADWDRNRFEDDPGKEGRFLANQHLLYRFNQMNRFHQELLGNAGP